MDEEDYVGFDLGRTQPSPMCEASPSCGSVVAVIFLGTGAKMCAAHAVEELRHLLTERDTDPAPPGSPTLPPPSDGP